MISCLYDRNSENLLLLWDTNICFTDCLVWELLKMPGHLLSKNKGLSLSVCN